MMIENSKRKLSEFFSALGLIFSLFAVPAFTVNLLVSLLFGGDALNGHYQEGKYYLSSHGELIEITQGFFLFSFYLNLFTVTTFSAMMLSFILASLLKERT